MNQEKLHLSTASKIRGILCVLLLTLPLFTRNSFIISTLIYCFLFSALGVAWNFIGGYGAQISWCHSSFLAMGAYSSVLLFKNFGISPFLSLPVGMVIAFLLATLIGYGSFRLRGPFFSLSTIAFAEIVRLLLMFFKGVTNGSVGLTIAYTGTNAWNLLFPNDFPFYYIFFFVMLLVIFVAYKFERSKLGYYLGAVKGNEDAAVSLGIESFKVKLRAFQISAIICSGIGTIYAFYMTYIDPTSVCSLDFSVRIGIVAIVGGLGQLWGPVLGAFLLMPLIQGSSLVVGNITGASQLFYGVVLIAVILFKPEGLIHVFKVPKRNRKVLENQVTR